MGCRPNLVKKIIFSVGAFKGVIANQFGAESLETLKLKDPKLGFFPVCCLCILYGEIEIGKMASMCCKVCWVYYS